MKENKILFEAIEDRHDKKCRTADKRYSHNRFGIIDANRLISSTILCHLFLEQVKNERERNNNKLINLYGKILTEKNNIIKR